MFFLVFYCHFFACAVPFLSSLFFLLSCLSSYFLILPCPLCFSFFLSVLAFSYPSLSSLFFFCPVCPLIFLSFPVLSCPIFSCCTSIYPSEDSLGVPCRVSFQIFPLFFMFYMEGELVFPVLFLYPEFGETDFVEEWRESETLEQHIQVRTVRFPYTVYTVHILRNGEHQRHWQRIQIICMYCTVLCALCLNNKHKEGIRNWNNNCTVMN